MYKLTKNYSEPEATCSNLHKIIQNLRPRIQIYKKKYLEPVRVDDTQAKIQYMQINLRIRPGVIYFETSHY